MELVRWQNLMQSFGISTNESTYQALQDAYSETHRRYHTAEHIKATLRHLDTAVTLAKDVHEVEMALWFHDAVYKPLSATNEFDSAVWAVEFLSNNGVSEDRVERVRSLIMATVHTAQTQGNDQLLLVDIDLSILGAKKMVYDQFEKDVRYEYKWVPYFIYKKKRKEVLVSFLKRERIYQNDFFYSRLEEQARDNLERVIASY